MTRAVALGIAVVLTALPGEAQEMSDVPTQTPRSGAVEIRLGGYKPALDAEEALDEGERPYADTFGASSMLLVELEMQRFFYQGIGTAGVSVSLGYAEKYAAALTEADVPSAERTGLHVLPIRVRGVYRFDYPAFRWGIPLVPYIKPGLVFTPWWSTKGGEIESPEDGGTGKGLKFGWEVAGGVAFLLDVLEPRLARDFDSDLGVNHSYLFAEYTYAKVNNFGGKGFDLSDGYWMFGLALDY
jgi:hypothetical protein